MKILYCIDHLRADGTQHVLAQLVEGLEARGHQQFVLCLSGSDDMQVVGRLRAAHAEVRSVGKLALLSGYGVVQASRWMRSQRFEVGVTFLFASDIIGRSLMHTAGLPCIISSLRARNIHYTRWQRWLIRRSMRWADTVVLNSTTVRDFAIAAEGARPDQIVVIPNGVQVEDYAQPIDRAVLRAELDLPPDAKLIGSVGRLNRQKGFDVLIAAIAQLARPDAHLLLIGAGEEEAHLRAQARSLDLETQVHWLGYRRDVPRLLGAFDLYVQPSRFEGMPNALLEAMAAGCPIVASAVDGICELIDHGVQGWLVPVENSAALAEAIEGALHDRGEAQRRAANAQQRVKNEFSLEGMTGAWEKVLSCASR